MFKKPKRAVTTTAGVAELIKRLNKRFGAGTAVSGKAALGLGIDFYSTGSLALDIALRGGFPLNRIVEIIGEESTCKTSLLALASQGFLRKYPNGLVVHADLENSVDFHWLGQLGCDLSRNGYLYVYASSGEEAGDIINETLQSRSIPIAVFVDSIMGLVPLSEMEGDFTQQSVARQPALINKIIKVTNARLKNSKVGECPPTSLILVNQTRPRIGGAPSFTSAFDSSGGQGRKFFSGQRILFTKGSDTFKEEATGGDMKINSRYVKRINFSILKNKCGGPEENGFFVFYNKPFEKVPRGMDDATAALNYGLVFELFRRKGHCVYFGKRLLGRGADQAIEAIRADKVLLAQLREALLDAARVEFSGGARYADGKAATGLQARKPLRIASAR